MAAMKDSIRYDEQQCFKIKFNDVEYYARLPRNAPGFYLLIWTQGELHGNGQCRVRDRCCALPILELSCQTFYASLKSLWSIMPAVVVRLSGSATEQATMTKMLQDDLQKLQKPIGPCKRLGLMTGGGLPHGRYACGLRAMSGVDEILKFVWSVDGRYVPGVRYLKTRQALLLTETGRKSELSYHRDNNIFEDSPQVYRLQAAVIQHPPATKRFKRTGTLLSIVPETLSTKRTMAEILATRDSMCECGRPGKGALDRPTPTRVLCGPRMNPDEARKSSIEELVSYITKYVDKRSYVDIPLSLLSNKHANYTEFDKILATEIGRPIKSISTFLHVVADNSDARRTAIRGLMGGLDQSSMHQTRAISCVSKAVEVYAEARRTMDVVLIKQWIGGGGRGTRRTMSDSIQVSKVSRRKK